MGSDSVTSWREISPSLRDPEEWMRRVCADVPALWQANMTSTVASGQAAICGFQEMTGAMLAFLQSRAKDGLTAAGQLAACDSLEDVAEVQLEYGKAMLQAGTDDLARLSALARRVAADVVAPLCSRPDVVRFDLGGRRGSSERGPGALAA